MSIRIQGDVLINVLKKAVGISRSFANQQHSVRSRSSRQFEISRFDGAPNLERRRGWERLAKGLETSWDSSAVAKISPLVRFHGGLHLPADIVIHGAKQNGV